MSDVRVWVVALLLLLGAAMPALGNPCLGQLEEGGIGGTGGPANEGGIGGTGRPARGDGGIGGTGKTANEGGIGGTGKTANEGGIGGTGIVGVITGFGSVCVNGVEVDYDGSTPVVSGAASIDPGSLAIGHVVAVEAVGQGSHLRARSIEVLHAAVGPVGRVDPATGRAEVLGQRLVVPPQHMGMLQRAVDAGMPVKVSGLRLGNGDVRVTRVDPAGTGEPAQVTGPITRMVPGGVEVQGLRVPMPSAGSQGLAVGREVSVSGALRNGAIDAPRVVAAPETPFAGRVGRMVMEGFVSTRNLDRVEISGSEVRVDRKTRFADGDSGTLRQGQRVIVTVRVEGKRLMVEQVQFIPDTDRVIGHPTPDGRGRSDNRRRGRDDGDDDNRSRSGSSGSGSEEESASRGDRQRADDSRDDDADDRRTSVGNGSSGSSGKSERSDDARRSVSDDGGDDSAKATGTAAVGVRGVRIESHDSVTRDAARAAERIEKLQGIEKTEKAERIEKLDRVDKTEKVERIEKVEKVERVEKVEKVERIEKPEKVEKVERIEKPEKVERVERIEKPEKVERVEKIEKPEKLERVR